MQMNEWRDLSLNLLLEFVCLFVSSLFDALINLWNLEDVTLGQKSGGSSEWYMINWENLF